MCTAVMNITEIKKRAEFANKTALVYDRGNYVEVIFNAHGTSVRETLVCMKNLINLIRCPFKLSVIHGYRHGQAIMKAIRTTFCSPRVCRMCTDFWNPGITHFWVNGDAYIHSYAV